VRGEQRLMAVPRVCGCEAAQCAGPAGSLPSAVTLAAEVVSKGKVTAFDRSSR